MIQLFLQECYNALLTCLFSLRMLWLSTMYKLGVLKHYELMTKCSYIVLIPFAVNFYVSKILIEIEMCWLYNPTLLLFVYVYITIAMDFINQINIQPNRGAEKRTPLSSIASFPFPKILGGNCGVEQKHGNPMDFTGWFKLLKFQAYCLVWFYFNLIFLN